MRQPVRDREGGGSSYPSVKQMLKGKNRLFFPFQTFKHAVLAGECPLKGKICHIFTFEQTGVNIYIIPNILQIPKNQIPLHSST